jgi:hypothetical protein
MFNRLKEYSTKALGNSTLFIILGILTVLPLVLLSLFYNPGSDDFDYSYESQTEAFWPLQIRRYYQWSGRYFSNGLLSLNPLTYENYTLLKVVPILLLALFVGSLYYFISSAATPLSSKSKLAFVGGFTFLYIAQLPDICEGFYWMPGSLQNQLPTSLVLLFFGSLLRFYQHKKSIHFIGMLGLLGALLGCNELTVVLFLLLMLGIFFYRAVILKKPSTSLGIYVIATLLFSLVEVLAPGNAVRATNIPVKHQLFLSLFKSVQLTIGYSIKWMPLVMLVAAFFLDSIKKELGAQKYKEWFIHPLGAFALLLATVYCGIFPGMWSLNGPPPDRAINTIYFFFLFAAFYAIGASLHFLMLHKPTSFQQLKGARVLFGLLIVAQFLANEPIVTAYKDVLSGKAYRYDLEMRDRFNRIKACQDTLCVVPPLRNKPKTIYNEVDFSLTTDKNNWKNQEVSRYFRKTVVVSKPKDSIFVE